MKMIATIKAIDRHPFSYSSSSDGVFSLYQSNGCFNFISHSFLTPFFLLFSFITRQLLHYIRTIAIPVSFIIPTTIITLVHHLFLLICLNISHFATIDETKTLHYITQMYFVLSFKFITFLTKRTYSTFILSF